MDNKELYQVFDIALLIQKYVKGTLTIVERESLHTWLKESPANKSLFDEIVKLQSHQEFEEIYRLVDTRTMLDSFKKRYTLQQKKEAFPILKWLPYVAAVLIAVSTFSWFWYGDRPPSEVKQAAYEVNKTQDVQAGRNRAVLTFADGKAVQLSEDKTGIVVKDKGITYQNGGDELIDFAVNKIEKFILSTPRGGTYTVTLPDGTKVWLNASSTLKYPSQFTGDERLVELVGEAYFEVAKVRKQSTTNTGSAQMSRFKVKTKGQVVEVLGTTFNITAYDDEDIRTTLVEGSVLLTANNSASAKILEPGQQGVVNKEAKIKVQSVDTEKYTAWKDGFFYYKNTPVFELMKHIEKWYDVEVVYKNTIPKETFSGKIKRSTSLMGLMEILQVSTVNVKLEGQKLIVY